MKILFIFPMTLLATNGLVNQDQTQSSSSLLSTTKSDVLSADQIINNDDTSKKAIFAIQNRELQNTKSLETAAANIAKNENSVNFSLNSHNPSTSVISLDSKLDETMEASLAKARRLDDAGAVLATEDMQEQEQQEELYDDLQTASDFTETTADEIKQEFPEDAQVVTDVENNLELAPPETEYGSSPEIIISAPTDIQVVTQPTASLATVQPEDSSALYNHALMRDSTAAEQLHFEHLDRAYCQLKQLEDQIESAANDTAPSLFMNDKVRHLLQNFVQHLKFLESDVWIDSQTPLPKLYDYFLDREIELNDLLTYHQTQIDEALNQLPAKQQAFFDNSEIQQVERSSTENTISTLPISKTRRAQLKNKRFTRKLIYPRRIPNRSVMKRRPIVVYKNTLRQSFQTPRRNLRRFAPSPRVNARKTAVLMRPGQFASSKALSLYDGLTACSMSSFVINVEDMQRFYDSLFVLIPGPANITDTNANATSQALERYHKLHLLNLNYTNGIGPYEQDLKTMGDRIKTTPQEQEGLLTFYGRLSDFRHLNCNGTSCKLLTETLNSTLYNQTTLFKSYLNATATQAELSLKDILKMDEAVYNVALPQDDSNLLTQQFVDTINYKNQRLPALIQMAAVFRQNTERLIESLKVFALQQKIIDELLTSTKDKFEQASKSVGRVTLAIFSVLLGLFALF